MEYGKLLQNDKACHKSITFYCFYIMNCWYFVTALNHFLQLMEYDSLMLAIKVEKYKFLFLNRISNGIYIIFKDQLELEVHLQYERRVTNGSGKMSKKYM